jgi:hypothetical protein
MAPKNRQPPSVKLVNTSKNRSKIPLTRHSFQTGDRLKTDAGWTLKSSLKMQFFSEILARKQLSP